MQNAVYFLSNPFTEKYFTALIKNNLTRQFFKPLNLTAISNANIMNFYTKIFK